MLPLPLLILLSLLPNSAHSHSFKKLHLPIGSEAYAFDAHSLGPYTGLNDGRIIKFQRLKSKFIEFATTTPNRSKELCDGQSGTDLRIVPLCGRPVGLEYNHKTEELYILDAVYGLMKVGRGGGVAARLGKDVPPFKALDAMAIDPITGDVYYTDVGSIYFRTTNMTEVLMSNDTEGRLLKYDAKSGRHTVVLTGLAIPNGAAVSRDGSFVLVAEYIACRITRLWLKGPKANTSDIFALVPGNPDNIKRTRKGDFWVPVNIQKLYPKLDCFALAQRINADGQIVETLNFYGEYGSSYVTEVQEHNGSLFVASVFTDFVGIYRRLKC